MHFFKLAYIPNKYTTGRSTSEASRVFVALVAKHEHHRRLLGTSSGEESARFTRIVKVLGLATSFHCPEEACPVIHVTCALHSPYLGPTANTNLKLYSRFWVSLELPARTNTNVEKH